MILEMGNGIKRQLHDKWRCGCSFLMLTVSGLSMAPVLDSSVIVVTGDAPA